MRSESILAIVAITMLLGGRAESRAAVPATCRPIAAARRGAALALLGAPPAVASAFRASLCRLAVTRRLALVSYDINAAHIEPAWREPSADPRYPWPVLVLDGRVVGRLPEHLPGEYPLNVSLDARRVRAGLPAVLCLRATTDAVGDPPIYPALVWRAGSYVADPDSDICKEGQRGG